MLWTLYRMSIGPAMVLFGEGLLPFAVFPTFYRPLLWLVQHFDSFEAEYRLNVGLWLWLWETVARLG